MRPRLLILAGPNGAGKTTAAFSLLKDVFGIVQFLNADEIAKGLSPLAPDSVAVSAGKIMLRRAYELIEAGVSIAIETTLSSHSLLRIIDKAKAANYIIDLYYLWLPSHELAVARVAERVKRGGHEIPVPTIERRYQRGLANLFEIYQSQVDYIAVYEVETERPQMIAEKFVHNDFFCV